MVRAARGAAAPPRRSLSRCPVGASTEREHTAWPTRVDAQGLPDLSAPMPLQEHRGIVDYGTLGLRIVARQLHHPDEMLPCDGLRRGEDRAAQHPDGVLGGPAREGLDQQLDVSVVPEAL